MTRAEVIAMARGVGIWCTLTDVACAIDALERFAALVAATEREACAQVCDHYATALDYESSPYTHSRECKQAAAAIRARGAT